MTKRITTKGIKRKKYDETYNKKRINKIKRM